MSAFNTPTKSTGGIDDACDSELRGCAPSSVASSADSEVIGCAESPQASPIKAYPPIQTEQHAPIAQQPISAPAPTYESAAERVQRLVKQMQERALDERIKQQRSQLEQQERLEQEEYGVAALLRTPMPVMPSSTVPSSIASESSSLSRTSSTSSHTGAKPWHQRAESIVAIETDSDPNIIHMSASEFRDDGWSELERRRSQAHMFRAKPIAEVRRILDRPPQLPKRQSRPSTVPQPFSFDSETASFEQLADYHPPMPMFKSSEYHAEHAHELEMVKKQGKNRYTAPKPLTIPESPALKTRERNDLHNERHANESVLSIDTDDSGDSDATRTISFDRVSTRGMGTRASFKPQLTIPESPGLHTDGRGELRREQAAARQQAEAEREERERAEHAERVARALANNSAPQHRQQQRRELTVPESPAFLTRDRALARHDLLDSIRERQDVFDEAMQCASPYSDRKDAVRAPSFDSFLGRDVGAVARAAYSKPELTIPESPAFMTRDRAEARRQLQDSISNSMASSGDSFGSQEDQPAPRASLMRAPSVTVRAKPQLTVPESPMFATSDRSEARREQHREAIERLEQAAELANVENDMRERRERLVARRIVAQRRGLTVPESPALVTKMRSEVHSERLEALVAEEEERAKQLEAENRVPLRRIENSHIPRPSVVHKPRTLTIPESPALLTKMRGESFGIENF